MAANNSAAQSGANARVLTIERTFDAPREMVFRCWTVPDLLARWIGPREFAGAILAHDFRTGGYYRVHLNSAERGDHWFEGFFREIDPPARLVFTFRWTDADRNPTGPETLMTLDFAEAKGATRMVLRQTGFATETARDEHNQGWTSSFDRLAEILASF
ncbi:SRPBCC domain-containing protein [bacterium]|nr:SRPBCC domain-containing protein [bacterium]